MDIETGSSGGPYHPGELEVQRRVGVREEAQRLAPGISPILTPVAMRLMASHRLAVAASLDESSRVWASLLTGPPGFLRPVDERLMLIQSHPRRSDPLSRNLQARGELGVLAIHLGTRQRLRINGQALLDPERGIFVAVEQVYGNCPKYIQARRLDLEETALETAPPERSSMLNARQRSLITGADTLFVASYHPKGGPDASHRGGAPGFVRLLDERTLVFADYPGNNMFNTLGNLLIQPRAGLLFLDFGTGDTLQLTGAARLDWDPVRVSTFRGAQDVAVTFEIEEVLETRGAGVRGQLVEYSPVNP